MRCSSHVSKAAGGMSREGGGRMALLTVERGVPTAEELAVLAAVVTARLRAKARLRSNGPFQPGAQRSGPQRSGAQRSGAQRSGAAQDRRLAPWAVHAVAAARRQAVPARPTAAAAPRPAAGGTAVRV
jgi:hypothetical protein